LNRDNEQQYEHTKIMSLIKVNSEQV